LDFLRNYQPCMSRKKGPNIWGFWQKGLQMVAKRGGVDVRWDNQYHGKDHPHRKAGLRLSTSWLMAIRKSP